MLDPDIQSVITEETAAYFAGDKSAWDVVRIIQSRWGLFFRSGDTGKIFTVPYEYNTYERHMRGSTCPFFLTKY